jgi:molybdate transport system substrate-binding protein
MTTLQILSGGAAMGLMRAHAQSLHTELGVTVEGSYGAVGAMKAKLLDGTPCDVLILTQSMIDELTASGWAQPGSARAIGRVKTGLAVKPGQAHPPEGDANALREALLQATGIYCPDPQLATAGIHFMKVLQSMGIDAQVADRLRTFPNGATAMKAMADQDDPRVMGCTQTTEILITPGVQWVGDLPKAYELATTYTVAIASQTQSPQAVRGLIDRITHPDGVQLRRELGFWPMS